MKKRRIRSRLTTVNAISIGIAICAFMYSIHVDSPQHYAQSAERMAASAAASLSASVPANPYNTAAQQLAQKEQLLNDREAQIAAEEAANSQRNSITEMLGLVSFLISIVLLVLVGINFYLDARRNKKRETVPRKFLVDMR